MIQQKALIENIQRNFFWTSQGNTSYLCQAKTEILLQIRQLEIGINTKGLFQINRQLLLTVN